MQRLSLLCALAALLLAPGGFPRAERPAGRFGSALPAGEGAAVVPSSPAHGALPLTLECWVKLEGKRAYNIIAARESKQSATHWELFTTPNDGFLCAYFPGRRPDHARTTTDVADGQWHYLAMVLETGRVRLYVDGAEKANVAVTPPPAQGIPGPLAFGALATSELVCAGQIDEVRLSRVARPVAGVPDAEFAPDADTLGLWHFNEPDAGTFRDASAAAAHATFLRHSAGTLAAQSGGIPGGMPAALQPLPSGRDTGPLRAQIAALAESLKLASVDAAGLRSAVIWEWMRDLQFYGGRDYPEARPGGADPEAVKRQVLDRHALIWETDGGPVGTVLRRSQALLDYLRRQGGKSDLSGPAADLRLLQAAYARARPARGSIQERAYYLAACALRRSLALRNPLLDFDTILCVARGTFAGSVRSNPANQDYQGGHLSTQYFGFNALPGGGLFLVSGFRNRPKVTSVLEHSVVRNGRLKGRKLDHGAFATPDLSFDGKTVVFAWTANSEHRWIYSRKTAWHLFRVNVDGSNLVQLSDGANSDFDPCWLPDGRIAFISERRGGHIRCFAAYLRVRNYTLFSMKADGSDITPLSYYETSEWNPTVNNDGQIVYTRWDYTDRENCLGTRFWVCNPDGTDPRAPHGNYPHPYHTFADHVPWLKHPDGRESDSRRGTPLVEMGIRAIPGSPRYVFTGAPHHGEVYGSLCLLDLGRDDDGHMSQVRRITSDEPFPESEIAARRHYKYGTPWPLSEDVYLSNAWENLVLLDRFGNREVLCDLGLLPCPQDERLRLVDPIPVRLRPTPPAIPARIRQGRATVAVMNVYDSDLPFPKGTRIKWLRVMQNILKENHPMGQPMIGYERENTPRIPLGVVPVEADGSAHFEAPVAKELIFQVLDENYMAVHSMRSVAFVHPGERLTCVGCHEGPRKAPRLYGTPAALRRPPSKLQPELGRIEPISYYRQIRPIFEAKCVPCHAARGKGPRDMRYEALRDDTFWFSGAMAWDMCNAYSGVHGGSRTIPGRFGARASRLGRALLDETHRAAVPPEDRHAVILWLDSNSLRLGSYYDEDAQLRGELVWPRLDVDPENPLGVEGAGRSLRGSFWHENLHRPHAFLGSSHQRGSVYLMDRQGRMAWEYPAPSPQDVWMLPNGNVLTTSLRAVQEVTRDKRVVWEYCVEAPNEIPTCQPLPEGNVLIGIVGECRLVEVNRAGDVVHHVRLSTTEKAPHAQFRMCRKTPEGTYLVPFLAEGAVREYRPDGSVLRTFPRKPSPVCALRLPDGNTLISAGRSVTEYDRSDRVVWELAPEDLADYTLEVLAGIQRLPNGNTVVCNWGARAQGDRIGAHILEVTAEKRVVWEVGGTAIGQVAQCQLLSDAGTPTDAIVR